MSRWWWKKCELPPHAAEILTEYFLNIWWPDEWVRTSVLPNRLAVRITFGNFPLVRRSSETIFSIRHIEVKEFFSDGIFQLNNQNPSECLPIYFKVHNYANLLSSTRVTSSWLQVNILWIYSLTIAELFKSKEFSFPIMKKFSSPHCPM